MQYANHIPLYFHERDEGTHAFSRHIINGNGNFIDHRGYNMFASKSFGHHYLGYDKETMRQIMHYQDETFRCQVQELHRLYRRQRELMDDITMGQIFMRGLQSQPLKSVQTSLSQAQFKNEEKPRINSIMGEFLERQLSHTGHFNGEDSEHVSFKARDSSGNEKRSKFLIDLNEPLMPEPLTSSSTESCYLMGISQHNQQINEEAKSESVVAKGHAGYDIDLNSMPLSFPSESAVRYENHDHNVSKANSYIDLNTNEENELEVPLLPNNRESYPLRIISEDVPLEPRRGEPSQELDRIAAETLVEIFTSARLDMHSSDVVTEDLIHSSNLLSWFADVISSLGDDDRQNKVHDQSNFVSDKMEENSGMKQSKTVKRKSLYLSCVVGTETQSGTQSHKSRRFAARDEKRSLSFLSKDNQVIKGSKETGSLRRNPGANVRKHTKSSGSYDVKKPKSSVLKQLGMRNKQCVLHDWGKIKKRRGGSRRSKYQVTT